MAVAIHIDHNAKTLTHVTGVTYDQLNVSQDAPADVDDVNAVRTGIVFSDAGGSADDLKTYLTNVLATIVAASDAAGWAYGAYYDVGGAHVGTSQAFFHSGNGTTHVVLKRFEKAYAASPRNPDYQIEFSFDGDYDEAGTDAKTFYDDLLTKKNLL